jgi:glutamine cyclotransferase
MSKKDSVGVTKIEINLGDGVTKTMTVEQIKALRDSLNSLFPKDDHHHHHHYPYYSRPWTVTYDTINCGTYTLGDNTGTQLWTNDTTISAVNAVDLTMDTNAVDCVSTDEVFSNEGVLKIDLVE